LKLVFKGKCNIGAPLRPILFKIFKGQRVYPSCVLKIQIFASKNLNHLAQFSALPINTLNFMEALSSQICFGPFGPSDCIIPRKPQNCANQIIFFSLFWLVLVQTPTLISLVDEMPTGKLWAISPSTTTQKTM
jgi:hypothetical protein